MTFEPLLEPVESAGVDGEVPTVERHLLGALAFARHEIVDFPHAKLLVQVRDIRDDLARLHQVNSRE